MYLFFKLSNGDHRFTHILGLGDSAISNPVVRALDFCPDGSDSNSDAIAYFFLFLQICNPPTVAPNENNPRSETYVPMLFRTFGPRLFTPLSPIYHAAHHDCSFRKLTPRMTARAQVKNDHRQSTTCRLLIVVVNTFT